MSNTKYLEESLTLFENGDSRRGIEKFSSGLSSARNKMNEKEWKVFIEDIKNGVLVKTAIKCPFTEHAVLRPSGYPGDAGLIDHIYGYKSPLLDDFTKAIYSFTTNSPSSRAVRYRRYLMSILIDKTIHLRGESTSILAVACGHLRELDLCRTLLNIRPKRFIALDQDIESLKEVEKCFSKYGVSTL